MFLQRKQQYVFLVFLVMGMAVFPNLSTAATLHAILIGDTTDSSIGQSVKVDMKRLQNLVANISNHTGLTLNLSTVMGDQLSRSSVERAIESASIGSDDVVFFFWNGHGYSRGESVLPTMSLKRDSMGLSEVKTKLSAKSPRLLIVIGDTCNVGSEGPVENRISGEKPENYRELFLKYKGVILASGSKKGYYSWGNSVNGGFYTVQFLESLSGELAVAGRPSWESLMSRADKVIQIKPGTIQPPQSKVEVSYVNGGGGNSVGGGSGNNNITGPVGVGWTCETPEEKIGDKTCCQASNGKRECWNEVW